MKKIRVAIVGYGGIARVHNNAYQSLLAEGYPVELVAVCDRDVSRITASLTLNLGNESLPLPQGIHIYSDASELLEREEFDIADICLPTFLHKEMSCKMLFGGKHVLCEKPMALSYSDCLEMISAAKESGKRLMIGQVLRFWESYRFLFDAVRSEKFGKLDNIYMDRHSVYPTWGASFADNSVTGGATLDTHIHDVDAARFILGEPDSIFATEFCNLPNYQVVTSTLKFGDTTAIINCSWDSAYAKPFTSGYRARFERASVVCDDGAVTVTELGAEPYKVELAETDPTAEEIRYFIDGIISGEENTKNSPEDSAESVRLIEKIRQSAKEGKVVDPRSKS